MNPGNNRETSPDQPVPCLRAAWKILCSHRPAWGKDSGWDGRNRCSLAEMWGCMLADRIESQSWKDASQHPV